MDYQFFIHGEKTEIKAERNGDVLTLALAGQNHSYGIRDLGGGQYLLRQGNTHHRLITLKAKNKIFVITDAETYTFELPASKDSDAFGAEQSEHGDKSKICAPMPGKVVKVLVNAGDTVEPKQKLLIVEAMKMENPLVAPFKAEILKINCEPGELVDSDRILIELRQLT
jgi:biotin carboxyl carrier protein